MTKPMACLFLGSGASYALAGIPTTKDFIKEVMENRTEWLDKCEDERNRIKINGKPLSTWITEIEDIELAMSYLHSIAYSDPLPIKGLSSSPRRHAVRAIVNLRAAIAQYIDSKHRQLETNKPVYRRFVGFINGVRKRSELVTVTTNYDLILEKVLPAEFYYPTLSRRRRRGIPLYKLHGSINWLEERLCEGKILRSYNPPKLHIDDSLSQLSEAKKTEERGSWAYLFSMNEQTGKGIKNYNPILIPFLFQKDAWLADGRWKGIFMPHWDHAEKRLSNNRLKHVYFFGYSLPPADYNMLTFLLKVLNGRNRLKITIVRKSADNSFDKPTLLEKALAPFNPDICRCGMEGFLLQECLFKDQRCCGPFG